MADWTSREYLGLTVILKEEFEEVGFMKLVADLKFLNFIYGLAQKYVHLTCKSRAQVAGQSLSWIRKLFLHSDKESRF